MIDEKRIKYFIEGAKEAFKKVDNPTFTFPMNILSAYELATSIEELLKEQEARILDWDELEDWENAVWFEDKDEHECYIALIANVGIYDATFVNVEPGKFHRIRIDFLREFYKKEWRCWSARPTIKQRQAVNWNERR